MYNRVNVLYEESRQRHLAIQTYNFFLDVIRSLGIKTISQLVNCHALTRRTAVAMEINKDVITRNLLQLHPNYQHPLQSRTYGPVWAYPQNIWPPPPLLPQHNNNNNNQEPQQFLVESPDGTTLGPRSRDYSNCTATPTERSREIAWKRRSNALAWNHT